MTVAVGADKRGIGEEEAQWQFAGGSYADPRADRNRIGRDDFGRIREPQHSAARQIPTVEVAVYVERLAQSAGATRQFAEPMGRAQPLHRLDAVSWFDRADQDRAGDALGFGDDVETVARVNGVNVSVAGWAKHRGVAACPSPKCVVGGIVASEVGLGFDNAASQENTPGGFAEKIFPQQGASYLLGGAIVKSAVEHWQSTQQRFLCALAGTVILGSAGSDSAIIWHRGVLHRATQGGASSDAVC